MASTRASTSSRTGASSRPLGGLSFSKACALEADSSPLDRARHYVVASGVDREDLSSDHSPISLVSRSTKTKASGPADSTKGQMDLSGWVLTPHSASSVRIQHVSLLSPSSSSSARLPPALQKVLITELAAGPARVAEFIGAHGHAPFFVRWGEGPAQLDGSDGNLAAGEASFRVGGGGEGTMKGGEQKCWLQWSEKMYERGIEIDVEPKGAATIAKVDGIERTAELVWSDEVKDGATVTLRRAEGDGAEDLFVGGQFLDSTVGMAKGAAVVRRSKSKRAVKEASVEDDSPAPARTRSSVSGPSGEDAKPKVRPSLLSSSPRLPLTLLLLRRTDTSPPELELPSQPPPSPPPQLVAPFS